MYSGSWTGQEWGLKSGSAVVRRGSLLETSSRSLINTILLASRRLFLNSALDDYNEYLSSSVIFSTLYSYIICLITISGHP